MKNLVYCGAFSFIERTPSRKFNSIFAEFWQNHFVKGVRLALQQLLRSLCNLAHEFGWSVTCCINFCNAGFNLALQCCNANHVEVIEIRGEDCEETTTLQEWNLWIFSELENPLIESKPRELAIDQTATGIINDSVGHVASLPYLDERKVTKGLRLAGWLQFGGARLQLPRWR